jgi:hypothetical protein
MSSSDEKMIVEDGTEQPDVYEDAQKSTEKFQGLSVLAVTLNGVH